MTKSPQLRKLRYAILHSLTTNILDKHHRMKYANFTNTYILIASDLIFYFWLQVAEFCHRNLRSVGVLRHIRHSQALPSDGERALFEWDVLPLRRHRDPRILLLLLLPT